MDEADIVVVGGGSGGCAATGRLSEDPALTVCLLEAGGRADGWRTRMPGMMPFQKRTVNWRFETVPQPGLNGRRGYQPRGRGLGGSSAINAMLYVRGHPWDYDHWASLGCTGWGWDDVLPWFRRAEGNARGADAWHGADGPLRVSDQSHAHPACEGFIRAAERMQIPRNDDFNGARQDGAGLYQVTQHGGERWSAARAYLDPARGRANVSVQTETLAERILFQDGRAVGVRYRQGDRVRTVRARRGVVLAGGVFGTPQLLMLSGIGPAGHLAGHGIPVLIDRAGIGGNLQDHLDYTACFSTPGTGFLGRSLAGSVKGLRDMARWFAARTGPMTTPYAEAGAFFRTDPALPAPDIQLHFLIAIVEDHGRTAVPGHGFSCHACVLRPESRGTVRLQSADPAAPPLIDPAFLSDERDLDRLIAGVRTMYRMLDAPEVRAWGGVDRHPVDPEDGAALAAMIRARADTIYHPVGTARMGSDADAVCDPGLAVRGVDGLWIADASIMPTLIGGNTNAPSVMIGERCASFVADHLRQAR
ncbi:GMC family oxidoreductase [Sphingomonas sp. FW199]|uniref:GMC family oxidoreductase n=1 Tax=Sphingomonas sp. FW199 TaxID=3400217 RepID=UPI003CF81B33